MKQSSARQQEFDFAGRSPVDGGRTTVDLRDTPTTEHSTATSTVSFSDFAGDSLYALTSRRAGRLNAASIPQTEVDAWLHERQQLLDKEIDGTLTRSETIRLTYVRWNLARIDDARHGEALDRLESWIAEYERFGDRLDALRADLSRHKTGSRR
jgi:hypothetical protein